MPTNLDQIEDRTEQPGPVLIRPSEAATAMAISTRKLWNLTHDGAIPCVRIGRSVRYDVADVRRWIDERKTNG